MSIAAVERETGLGKDTLRAWERRYGYPTPARDGAGMRAYTRAQVERLRLIRRALLAGQRPGRLLALPAARLDALLAEIAVAPAAAGGLVPDRRRAPGASPAATGLDLDDCLRALRNGGVDGLRHWLTRGMARLGLAPFVTQGLAPLTTAVGLAWVQGGLAVYEEHLYSEAVKAVLRTGLLPFQSGLEISAPRVLLTTLPGEQHGLGLLMAEAMLTLEACRCVSLGVETPIDDIVAASRAHRIDLVALSFTESLPLPQAQGALADLRSRLPAAIPIWVGGNGPLSRSVLPAGVRALVDLGEIPGAVSAWRDEYREFGR